MITVTFKVLGYTLATLEVDVDLIDHDSLLRGAWRRGGVLGRLFR